MGIRKTHVGLEPKSFIIPLVVNVVTGNVSSISYTLKDVQA